MDILYLVIPCYNEEEVLPETSKRLKRKLTGMIEAGQVSPQSRILFVDDGSKDKTWSMICDLHEGDNLFSGVKLSRNRGHQNALLAGLMTAKQFADITISMDADLQDDIEVIDQFVEKYRAGCDIVYGVRSKRDTDSFGKRVTAEGFYKFMKLLGVDSVYNHADYRLMSKRALDGLEQFEEVNLFLRGIVPQIGYKWDVVTYERNERFAGESKYPLKKMLSFALDGITSFSVKPLGFLAGLGIAFMGLSVLMLLILLIVFLAGTAVSPLLVLGACIWLLSGVQLTGMGILGAYIGKTYKEVKHRPRFLIETVLNR